MISEQRLKSFEECLRRAGMDGEAFLGIGADDLAQLIAAARVANAAARLEREERDARPLCLSADKQAPFDPQHHLNRARADLARALRHYSAGEAVRV